LTSVFQSHLYIKIICFCAECSNEEPPLHYYKGPHFSAAERWRIDGMFERGGYSLQNRVSMIVASGSCTHDAISTDSIAVPTEHLSYPHNIHSFSTFT